MQLRLVVRDLRPVALDHVPVDLFLVDAVQQLAQRYHALDVRLRAGKDALRQIVLPHHDAVLASVFLPRAAIIIDVLLIPAPVGFA